MKVDDIAALYHEAREELERQRRDNHLATELRFKHAMIELGELAEKVIDYYSLPETT
jgi:hypothetical protein